MNRFCAFLAFLTISVSLSLFPMERYPSAVLAVDRVKTQTERNEIQFNKEDCRPFVTLTAMQTAPRFHSLIAYVNQLTNYGREKVNTENGFYELIDPDRWHVSLVTLALPLSDRLMRLSRSDVPGDQNKFRAERPKFAEQALKDFAAIVARHVHRLKNIQFSYRSIGGIGTNKFIAAYFDFENPAHSHLYHQVYADIISDFLEKYPQTWMRYGFEFYPHVSVMQKFYPEGKIKIEGQLCKGSGRDVKKTSITTAPAAPITIQNLELLFRGRHILVTAKTTGYPVSPNYARAAEFTPKGELTVTQEGTIERRS